MSNNCQVPTPKKYVKQMLNYIKYKDNLYGKRVLENSCGEGNILYEIVKRYITDSKKNNISNKKIIKGIENDIVAYEVDVNMINKCIQRLDELAASMGLLHVCWNINKADYLKQPQIEYDYIIGNPPYTTYHDISDADREFLKSNFESCKEGRFDYSYAFIEASIKSLKENGKLIYLLPYGVVKNKFANRLREYMTPYITAIYDYTGISVFPDVITSSVILILENKKNKNYINYYDKLQKNKKRITRERLSGKWNFADDSETNNQRKFGDYFEVCNSVATLYNHAFIIQNYTENEKYYCVDGMNIEKQLVYPAISMKSYNMKKNEKDNPTRILFPYKVINGKIEHYDEKEFQTTYPMAVEYLKTFIVDLNNRKKDSKALWFEYGRSQAVSRVFGEKIVMPMVLTNNVSLCLADENAIPYAGYFIKCKENSTMTLENAREILQSRDFFEYVKSYGTPTTPNSYRISVEDIKEYKF